MEEKAFDETQHPFMIKKKKNTYKSGHRGNLPDGPMIKTSPSKARDEGSIPGQEDLTCLRAKKLKPCLGAKKLKHETQAIL